MSTLAEHSSNSIVKTLCLGDSKSGKTGSLVSLVEAGWKLAVMDYDNLLDSLKYQILARCPDKITNVHYRTFRDKRKMTTDGPKIDGAAKAFTDGIKMLDKWKHGDDDLGTPATWGPEWILVLDSLSRFCDAAFDWREPLTPRGRSGEYDKRATYGDAQNAVEDVLALLTSEGFNTNVIVICHGTFLDQQDGTMKIFPQGVGQKLSPKIPQYFPNYLRYTNQGGTRKIKTVSDPMIDLANTNPAAVKPVYDIENGLAEIFKALGCNPPSQKAVAKPTLVKRM
jgi:hypothetical protein